ncbi:EAL domain-containing protein [Sporosarcina trichiuri]|uniref:EAL domain-containing protein n=1 Tax=Sporosarcina trichiuri TaxID=3056445 RepID=UPI0025B51B41|nr:EAL domain-containing protein [Sporosarcina sp. 0.2-SM1T-5]WJY27052.1 EAL domain-containing protein [Sporosarcina sp. 0.2-SM1T-5]
MTRHHDMIRNISESLQHGSTEQLLNDIVYSLDNSAIVAVTDRTGTILYANDFFSRLSKYPVDELLGANQSIVNSGYHPPDFFKDMWRTIGSGRIWRGEICNRAKGGALYWVDTTIVPFLNERGIPVQYISIRHNITDKKNNEAALQKQLELYKLITQDAGDFVAVLDRHGCTQYCSPSLEKLLGSNTPELLDHMPTEEARFLKAAAAHSSAEAGYRQDAEFRLRSAGQEILQMSGKLARVQTEGQFKDCSVLSFHDVTAEREQELLIHDLASTDQLTGLLNRRAFLKELFRELEQAKHSGRSLGLVYVNIDKLRYANETFGHDTGDDILKIMAERLTGHLQGSICGRTAGDEFAFVLNSRESEEGLYAQAEAIHQLLEEPVEVAGNLYNPSVSCGLSMFPEHAVEVPGLMTTTEQAMQSVKIQGGSGFAIFTADMYTQSLDRIILENELRKSVKEKHFVLEYQPKVDLTNGYIVGFEALVRWEHPDLGRIPPGKFIGIAEETKVIIPLGEWILEEVFMKAKTLQGQTVRPVTLAVNLSAVHLESPGLIAFVEKLAKRTGIDPHLIEMEVTESAFADRLEMGSSLRQLRSLGFGVSIDDFGTGFSSFSYIREFPAETLKIDMSFVRDVETSENSRAIIQAIVTMADTAGLNVIAEGVETAEQAAILKRLGCREGQGYYYSRPLPETEAFGLVRKPDTAK